MSLVGEEMWRNGPRPGGLYPMAAPVAQTAADPVTHTSQPTVTGTGVLGIQTAEGVIIASDMLGSYGSLAKLRSVSRLTSVGNNTVVGGGGDLADLHYIHRWLEELKLENDYHDDDVPLDAEGIHCILTRVMYNRRSKFEPLWNSLLVGGFHEGKSFLGYVDKLGVAYKDPLIATGYGSHIALPLMRSAMEANPAMTLEQARVLIEKCMCVMFYRDARAYNRYQIATVTAEGVTISEPKEAATNWEIAHSVRGYE